MGKHDDKPTADACSPSADDDDAGRYLEEEMEKEWREFLTTLSPYPNCFQLQDERLSDNICRKVLETLQCELDAGFESPLEAARCLNLVAFLRILSVETTEAADLTEKVLKLKDEERNLTALANQAAILWRAGNRTQAEEKVKELEKLSRDDPYLVVKAKAELAYSCNRFGPSFYIQAEEFYTAAIEEGREPDVWQWKFGLALTKRRTVFLLSAADLTADKEEVKLLEVIRTFLEVIKQTDNNKLKAMCYAEVAHLLQGKEGTKLEKTLQLAAGLTALEACDLALKSDPDEVSAMWKCGIVYRKARMLKKSCELLERSVALRPTTTQCHHLGITYKELALEHLKNNDEDSAEEPQKHSETTTEQKVILEQGDQQIPTPNVQFQELGLEHLVKTNEEDSAYFSEEPQKLSETTTEQQVSREQSDQQNPTPSVQFKDQAIIQSNQSSPSTVHVQASLSRLDPYIQKAIAAMKQSLELVSTNIPARHDLALLYRDIGEMDKALKELNVIQLSKHKHMRPFEKINAYEQAGKILKTMSEQPERSAEERKKLKDECESKLNMALMLCSRLCNRLPGLQHLIKDVWDTLPTLLQAVEESDRNDKDKMKEKARLFQLIRDHRSSSLLLEEIASIAPNEAHNSEYLKLKVENFVGEKRYEEALTFISMLKCTAQGAAASGSSVFPEGDQYVQNIYVKAAEVALLSADTETLESCDASEFFVNAFDDALCSLSDSSVTTTSCSEDDGSSGAESVYGMMLVHEDWAEQQAIALEKVVKQVFGLSVTRMDEDCMPGRPSLDSLFRTMGRCRQVVVLAGRKKVGREMRLLLERAAKKINTVILLLEGDHVPKLLKPRRSMPFPSPLLVKPTDAAQSQDEEDGYDTWAHTVCDLFRFLTGIEKISGFE